MTGRALPRHDPRALLEAILNSFATSTGTVAPALAVWSVASPRFAARLGDPGHLAHLFGNAAWQPLIGHREATIASLEQLGTAARATVRITARDGSSVSYLATLKLMEAKVAEAPGGGESKPAWLLTGLVRSELVDA